LDSETRKAYLDLAQRFRDVANRVAAAAAAAGLCVSLRPLRLLFHKVGSERVAERQGHPNVKADSERTLLYSERHTTGKV
jgi:hypothetical protein